MTAKRTGFLPYLSDAAPINADDMNCRNEKSDPIIPLYVYDKFNCYKF